jgi:site-specific recombinase XerD
MDADNFRKRDYYPLLADLEIKPKNPHCTRHTFTSMIHASGAKEENIIKLVGHTDFRTTTENYIHQSVSELYETVKLLKI